MSFTYINRSAMSFTRRIHVLIENDMEVIVQARQRHQQMDYTKKNRLY